MIERLTADQLDQIRAVGRNTEYVEFLASLRKGQGGRVNVAESGVSRQSVKNRVNAAAAAAGVQIKHLRSGQDVVVFEVVGKG